MFLVLCCRSLVFILDRSGSMNGEPMHFAKEALQFGLGLLGPEDEFTVVAFDHEQLWFSPVLQQVSILYMTCLQNSYLCKCIFNVG